MGYPKESASLNHATLRLLRQSKDTDPKLLEFLSKVDGLCSEYGYSIRPTPTNTSDDTFKSIYICDRKGGEVTELFYIDGQAPTLI